MDRYYIDLGEVKNREQLYDRLTEGLPLPEGCGRNLDALYDVFTGEFHEMRIFFRGSDRGEGSLGGYYSMFRTMCQEAMEQNTGLQIFFL